MLSGRMAKLPGSAGILPAGRRQPSQSLLEFGDARKQAGCLCSCLLRSKTKFSELFRDWRCEKAGRMPALPGCAPRLRSQASPYGFDARRGRSLCRTLSLARGRPDIRHSIRLIATVAVSAVEAPDLRTIGSSSLIVS